MDWPAPSLKNVNETTCRIAHLSGWMSTSRRYQLRLRRHDAVMLAKLRRAGELTAVDG